MSKRVKQYLMLFAALGVVAIALGGGSGTFASFNAEVSNNGNTFASGTLYLHDVNGNTECGSESVSTNSNLGTPYTANNGCAVLFSTTVPTGHATLGAGLTSGSPVSSLTISALAGNAIQAGDEIVLDDGSSHTQTFFATAAANPGDTTISVSTQNASFSFPAGTTVKDDARFTKLQLTNAGSLDASGISFSLGNGGCAHGAATTSTATLSGATSSGATVLNLSSPLAAGIPASTTITINSDTVTTVGATQPGASTINVTATPSAYSNGQSISWSLAFTGGGNLCTSLPVIVAETGSAFGHDSGTAALGCAYGSSLANFGCAWGSNTINSIGTTLQPLTLASGADSNTGTGLSAGHSRYFVIGIQSPGSLSNGSQNEQAKFDLVWHIDQA